MGIERGGPFPIGTIRAKERFERVNGSAQKAFDKGYFVGLSSRQRETLTTLYPLGNNGGTRETPLTFEGCGYQFGVSKQAIEQRHKKALRRFGRLENGQPPVGKRTTSKLEIDLARARFLFESGHTRQEVARELGCSDRTLYSRIREAGPQNGIRVKRGRPRKNIVQ